MKNQHQGFTFIEFLIYITLLSIVILAMGMVISNISGLEQRTNAISEVNYNGRFALQKIKYYTEKATALSVNEEGNALTLSGFEETDKNPTIFEVSDGTLVIKEGDKDWVPLTTQKVRVNYLHFQKVPSLWLNSIKVEMNISFYNPEGLPELNFSNFFRSSFLLGS